MQPIAGAARAPDPLAPGATLGAYRLLAVLGEGGMGIVYLAEHSRLGRKVALKLLRPELSDDPVAAARFLAEARAVNAIEHPNLVEITDIVEENGYRYYIMELLRGESLAALEARELLLPLPKVLDVAIQLAGALAATHEADIVHCDVKPDNVFVATEGGATTVKLIDFGIALLPGDASRSAPAAGRTARDLVGTPAYMSPEQGGGGPVTYETDVYSFGVLLYQAVSGRLPFEADTVEDMVLNHVGVTPPAPSAKAGPDRRIPPELDELVLHCLAKSPEQRPSSMQEIELRLGRIRDALGGKKRRLGAGGVPPWRQRRYQLAGAAGLGVVAIAAVAIAFATRGPAPAPAPVPARGAPAAKTGAPPGGQGARRPAAHTVAFDSTPRGAVVRDEAGKVLGVTPFKMAQPRGKGRRYVFELAGYASAIRKVSVLDDTAVTVQLTSLADAAKQTKKRPGH